MFMNFFFCATTLLLLATLFQDGHACSFSTDYHPSIGDQYKGHAFVFAGIVEDIESGENQDTPKNITFGVTKKWKTDDDASLVVKRDFVIQTPANGGLCGIEFNMNEQWVIFASASRNVQLQPNASTQNNICDTYQVLDNISSLTACLVASDYYCACDSECCSESCRSVNNKCAPNRHLRSSFFL